MDSGVGRESGKTTKDSVKSEEGTDYEKLYAERADRMIKRWSGIRTQPRSTKSLNPTESIMSRDQAQSSAMSPAEGETHDFYTEPSKRLPVLAKCEVLVVGAGPAGLSAALAADRAGADVVLMERFGCFGGVITTVGMETIGWYRYQGCDNDSEGIGSEMERLAAQMGGTRKFPYNDSECLDADYFKVVADHLIRESHIRPILHCLAVDAIMDAAENGQNAIKGIVTESKSGRQAIFADRVIDCSGDADIAHFAGAEYRKTAREEMMGMTTVFNAAGVDRDRFTTYTQANKATYADWSRTWDQETTGKEDALPSPYLDMEFERARQDGHIPKAETQLIGGSWSSLSQAGEATNLNLAHMMNLDCTNVMDLTRGEMEGREQAMYALQALKKVVPGFENAKLRNFGMTIGCRDSRKIIGRYNLTAEDVRNQGRFDDSVGIFPEFIDGYSILILPTTGRYFQVPLGCLIPNKVDNLLVAGRCCAGDKTSHCAMRNMMACTVTGQGAGVAAAVSVHCGKNLSETPVNLIQEELKRQKVRIE